MYFLDMEYRWKHQKLLELLVVWLQTKCMCMEKKLLTQLALLIFIDYLVLVGHNIPVCNFDMPVLKNRLKKLSLLKNKMVL